MKPRALIIRFLILLVVLFASVRLLCEFRIWRMEKDSYRAYTIREGMSCSEVQAILGEPTCVFRVSPSELKNSVWSLQENWLRPNDRWQLEDLEKAHESVLVYEYLKWIKRPYFIISGTHGFYTAVIFDEQTGRALLKRHNDFKSSIYLVEILDYRKRESDKRVKPLKQAN